MTVLFQPLTDFVLGKYFANEAAYAEMFTRFGMSPFPASKDLGRPTKTWNAPPTATYKWGGEERRGFLTVVEGGSVAVIDQTGAGEQFKWSTPIVPPQLGQLLTNFQHDFYVEYRDHADYAQGIPLLTPTDWGGRVSDSSWMAEMNFAAVGPPGRHLPPIDQGRLMSYGMRFKPGSTAKRLEDVEVFLIEAYRREFKPPVAVAKPAGEYQYDYAALARLAMTALMANGPNATAGQAIRDAAEARK